MAVTKSKAAIVETPEVNQELPAKPKPPIRKSSQEITTIERIVHYDNDMLHCLRMSVDDKIATRGIVLNESQQDIYSMIFI